MLSIAWKDLLILAKDRNALVGAFLLPIVFIVVYLGVAGAATGGGGGDGDTARVPLAVVNLDPDGTAATALIAGIAAEGRLDAAVYHDTDGRAYSEAEAMAKLDTKEVQRLLIVPAGFTADLDAGRPVSLRLLSTSLDPSQSQAVLMAVQGVTGNMSLERQIVASLERLAEMQRANPSFDPATSARLAIPIARRQFEESRGRPLVTVVETQPAAVASGDTAPVEISAVQLGVPGFAVLFIFLTAQVTARSIFDEKKTGTLRRLLASPLSRRSMLIGKLIPNFVIVLLQVMFLFAAGMFLLPLMGLDALRLGNDVPALVLLVLSVALCCTTLGILIASIARTEAQIGGIAGMVLWVLAFLGGCFIPLFLINESMATIGQVTPHYWAVTGFYDLLTRGQGLASVLDSIAVLLGFAAVFFVIGVRRFEFD